jgi:uncharacterized RDD family membrane protein YckC
MGLVPVPVDRFGRPLAGWWPRTGAIIMDLLILDIPKLIVSRAVYGSVNTGEAGTHWRASVILIGIIFAVVDVAYFALLNGSEGGQTVGQMALGITVRDEETGGTIGPQRAGLRIVTLAPALAVGWIPVVGVLANLYLLVAAFSPLWDQRRQGFHDKVAHSNVVKIR